MTPKSPKSHRMLEIFLIVNVIALAFLLNETEGFKLVVLNLFFLPVVLGGFFLGRYRAGVLALLCVVSASVVTVLDLSSFAAYNSPAVIGLAVVMWGAVIGLTALLVGTLSDERATKIDELHEAYVGVVEVLSHYLQSANPRLEAQSSRVALLSQQVATEMKLTPKEVDDIRVAALLHDMENIEVTSRVIRKAVGDLETEQEKTEQYTFHGTDLVHSLGSVLTGALPLLLDQGDSIDAHMLEGEDSRGRDVPLGAKIMKGVRAFDARRQGDWGHTGASATEALDELRNDPHAQYDPAVLDAIAKVVLKNAPAPREAEAEEPAAVEV